MDLQKLINHTKAVSEAYQAGIFTSRGDGSVHLNKKAFEATVLENCLKVKIFYDFESEIYPIETAFYVEDTKYYAIYNVDEFIYKGEQTNEQSTNSI